MQEYLQRSRFGEAMDALGSRILLFFLCLGWFILLWGLRLPALTAGVSLFVLFMLIEKKTRDARLARREKKLRMRLGGELFLEKLLMEPPARAHFESAAVFSAAYPLTLIRAGDQGVLCTLRKDPVLFSFLQLPVFSLANATHVLSLQRCAQEMGAKKLILCVPCKISPDAHKQAEGPVPAAFLDRSVLIAHFGAACPATDEQLVELGKRKKTPLSPACLLSLIFAKERAQKYVMYGLLLLLLYFLTHLLYYALPAMLCFFLAAGCHCYPRQKNVL